MSASVRPSLPRRVTRVTNKKQQLRNDIIDYLEVHNLTWCAQQVATEGERFVACLVDLMWYIDGHHEVFQHRSNAIPSSVSQFSGYNIPELSKHRKRSLQNMSSPILNDHANNIFKCLQGSYWMTNSRWNSWKGDLESLATSVSNYATYLKEQNSKMKRLHSSSSPIRQISENILLQVLPLASATHETLSELESQLRVKPEFEHMSLDDVCPREPRSKYRFLQILQTNGLSVKAAMLTYQHGNNVGNLHFVWRITEETASDFLTRSQYAIEEVKKAIPVYHTRRMRNELKLKYGKVTPNVKPAILRSLYRELTGDFSSSTNEHESEIDRRVQQLIEMEDASIIADLRAHNEGRKGIYNFFWSECQKFLEESVGTAVDDRRHCLVTHLAQAISARDLLEQVRARCPEGTPVPSVSWLSLQFWPKNHHNKAKLHYTGKLNVKYMVQARQFRKSHEDSHYAAALFRYLREMSLLFRQHSVFVCLDDKHRCKIGEPGFPVAAAERGRRVLVSRNANFEVGDHDFTRFSLIPSVAFLIDIPESIEDTWYTGQVLVGLKDAAFEPSSPERHACELQSILKSRQLDSNPVLFLYTDGGPDHRLTYTSVQVSLIALFRILDLDMLCVARTAPYHSWRNPVERVMSLLNMGLQSVGLMRKKMSDEDEEAISGCNSLNQLRQAALKMPHIKEACLDSVEPVKILLQDIFGRILLKEKNIKSYQSATDEEIATFQKALSTIDESIEQGEKFKKASLKDHTKLSEFYNHCCQVRHYSFCVKKCGKTNCHICLPPRLLHEDFQKLSFLPDPVPQEDGHYKPFDSVYGTDTSEEHRPSLQKRPNRQKTLPFVASVQHARNTNLMVQCEECEMWRLVYSKYKLNKSEKSSLQSVFEDFTYTCGASLSDLDLSGRLQDVVVRDLRCYDPLEKLYYSLNRDPICIYCCSERSLHSPESCYPQCTDCNDKPNIKKRQ